jgi:hypothetical protein
MGYDIWKSVVTGYTATKKPPKTATKKELKKNNKIAMDFILEGLCDSTKDKVGKCSSAKELWDKLHNIYFKESPITEPEHTIRTKKMQVQNKKKYAHHVRQIQKKKIVKKA